MLDRREDPPKGGKVGADIAFQGLDEHTRRLRKVGRDVAAGGLFTVMAVVWWWPLPLHLTSGQIENPPVDAAFNQWIVGWGVHALTTDPRSYFDANMFHPHDNVLAWGDHLFGLVILAVPLVGLLGVLGAHNLLLLATSAGSGFAAYKLGEEVTGDKTTGALAGVLWAFAAARRTELTHIQILATVWTPVVFLLAERWCSPRGQRRHLLWIALVAWLVLVTNAYLATFTALGMAVWCAAKLALRAASLRRLSALLGAGLIAAVAATPFYLPWIAVRSEMEVRRTVEEQSGARLDALLPIPLPGQPAQEVFGTVDTPEWRYDTVGLLTIGCLLVLVAAAARSRSLPGIRRHLPYLAVGVFGVLSAQGSRFRWGDTELFDNPFFLIPYYLVPGYDVLRVPHRWFIVVGLLGIVVYAIAGAAPVVRTVRRRARAGGAVLVTLAAAFVLFEQAPAPLEVGATYQLEDHPAYEWLARQPDDAVILELPISADVASPITQRIEAKRMYLSTFHWNRRVGGGISPVIDERYGPAAATLNDLGTDSEALELLDRYGVRYVLVVDADFEAYGTDPDAVRARLDATPQLRRLREFPDATVFENATY